VASKRTEQEWRELIHDFVNYGYQNPAVFYLAQDGHAHDLKRMQLELKTIDFIRVSVADGEASTPIDSLRLSSAMKLDILSTPALLQLDQTAIT